MPKGNGVRQCAHEIVVRVFVFETKAYTALTVCNRPWRILGSRDPHGSQLLFGVDAEPSFVMRGGVAVVSIEGGVVRSRRRTDGVSGGVCEGNRVLWEWAGQAADDCNEEECE